MATSLRQQQADLTRALVMDAAYALLVEEGYTGTTMAAVAHRAGVAVPTVYKAFGTKAELVKRLYDRTLVGDDRQQRLVDRPQAAAVLAEPDPHAAVAAYAELVAATSQRLGPLLGVLLAARSSDANLEDFVATIERERLSANQHFARHLATLGGLAVTPQAARDLLWLFTSPDVRARLVDQRGWSNKQFAAWLRATLVAQLLTPRRDG